MSPIAAILVVAALFALFGLVRRERERRCDACTPEARRAACTTCPLRQVDHVREVDRD